MRRFLLVFFLVCLTTPLSAATQRSELAAMKKQLAELSGYVKALEARLDAKEKGAGEAPGPAASPAAPAPAADPLEVMESRLGYSGGQPMAGVQRGGSAAGPAEPSSTGDALADVERDLASARSAPAASQNPRTAFNPQISVVSDFVYRASSIDEDPASPDVNGVPQGDKNRDRFSLRELEIAFQAAIDPFSRYDVFLELPGVLEEFEDDAEAAREPKIEVEEAYITYWRLPWGMQLKGGKFRLEFGKNNREHNDNQHAIERPLVITNFLGGEGIAEQGLSLQGYIPINGPSTQLELTGQLVNGEGVEETLFAGVGSDKPLALARAHVYHDFDDSNNVGVGFSYLTGHHDPAGAFRQRLRGVDVTFRYEPVAQNVYKQLIVRGEYIHSDRQVPVDLAIDADVDGVDDSAGDFVGNSEPSGGYLMAQYFWDRYWNVGVRYDKTDAALRAAGLSIDPDTAVRDRAIAALDRVEAHSIWFTHLTSEFNRWRLQYISADTNFAQDGGKTHEDLFVAQWIFAMGPHGAHKY